MSPRTVIWLLVALLVGSNAFWLYRAFDRGVTEAYQGQARAELARANDTAEAVLTALVGEQAAGLSADEALALLRRAAPDGPEPFYKDNQGTEPNVVTGAGVTFVLDDADRVVAVRTDA